MTGLAHTEEALVGKHVWLPARGKYGHRRRILVDLFLDFEDGKVFVSGLKLGAEGGRYAGSYLGRTGQSVRPDDVIEEIS